MPDATFTTPDLTTFTRLDELGVVVVGQRLEPDRAVLACRVREPDEWCRRCGCEGIPRDSLLRRLAHEPFGWRPTVLEVTVRRYRCGGCGHVWRQDTSLAAEPRAKLSRRALGWALEALVEAGERGQVGTSEGSVRHVEVFQMERCENLHPRRTSTPPRRRRAQH